MRRELLKRIRQEMMLPADIEEQIDDYLAQPDPEPVAWMIENHPTESTFANFKDNFNSHFEHIGCKVTPLYTTPPDQSARVDELVSNETLTREVEKLTAELAVKDARVAELEQQLSEAGKVLSEFVHKLGEAKQQLAALQANREPLSDEDIIGITELFTDDRNFDYYIYFAREIEAAHGITGEQE